MGVVQENAVVEVPAKVEAILNQIALDQVRKLIAVIDEQPSELTTDIRSSEAYCDIKRALASAEKLN